MKKALTQIFIFLTLGIVCYLVFCFVPGMHGHTHTIAETLTHMAPCKVVLSAGNRVTTQQKNGEYRIQSAFSVFCHTDLTAYFPVPR